MNTTHRNDWNAPTGHDTLLNGALLAVGMGLLVGLLLNVMDAPAPGAAQVAKAECATCDRA